MAEDEAEESEQPRLRSQYQPKQAKDDRVPPLDLRGDAPGTESQSKQTGTKLPFESANQHTAEVKSTNATKAESSKSQKTPTEEKQRSCKFCIL